MIICLVQPRIHICKENYVQMMWRYANILVLEQNQLAADIKANDPAALIVMKRNDEVAKRGSYENVVLFCSACQMWIDSLCWPLRPYRR